MQTGTGILWGDDVMKMNDTIRAMFEGCECMDKGKIIDRLVRKHGVKESTAQTYYYAWKKEFMHGANCVPVKPDIPEAQPVPEKKHVKSFVDAIIETQAAPWPETEEQAKEYTGVIIARDPQEPENDMVIECDDDADMKEYAGKCRAQGYEVEENVLEEKPRLGRFFPVIMRGDAYEYSLSDEGLRIISEASELVTRDMLDELSEAMDVWEKYYLN